jgi:hypothetical protein
MNIKLFSETTNLRRVPLEEQEQLTLLVHLSSLPVFSGVRATQSLVLCVYFVDHCLSFFFSPLCCLSFIDLQILITPLVSCPLCCLSFIDLRILITPLVSWPLCCLSFIDLQILITSLWYLQTLLEHKQCTNNQLMIQAQVLEFYRINKQEKILWDFMYLFVYIYIYLCCVFFVYS